MSLTTKELRNIARLARLALSEEELNRLNQDLSKIVKFVGELKEVNIDGVEPMSHAGDRCLFLREDRAAHGMGHRAISSSAGFEHGLIRVPKIID